MLTLLMVLPRAQQSNPERDGLMQELRQELRDVNSHKHELQEKMFALEEAQRLSDNDTQVHTYGGKPAVSLSQPAVSLSAVSQPAVSLSAVSRQRFEPREFEGDSHTNYRST